MVRRGWGGRGVGGGVDVSRVTVNGRQVVHGEFEALASPDDAHSVPLVIVQARPRKDGLWSLTYTQPRAPLTHTQRPGGERERDTAERGGRDGGAKMERERGTG